MAASLKGKRFIVTGATRGIGRGLADALLGEGARVAICGRDRGRLDGALAEMRGRGGEVIGLAADVGRDADARRLAEKALKEFGGVDFLINNAAVLARPATVVEAPPETWEEVLRANVIGTVNMIRHVLPAMQDRRAGAIINLSSGWGRIGEARVASYCASKFAVEGLTQSVAEEAGEGVTVFAVNPGVIATDMLAEAFEQDVSRYDSPAAAAKRWLKLLQGVKRSWNGKSLNLDDF